MDNRKTKNRAHRIPQLVARPASAEYKRVWRAMRKVIDELAAEHFEYVTGFLALWYRSSNIVDATAEGLICDGIIKDPNFGCGLLIIHHTNKPPSGPERLNFGRDQFAQYIGAGGQVLNRWGRSFLTLLPTKEPNVFHLVAAKREKRLDWIIPPGVTSSKPLKVIEQEPKESGYLFWHEMAIDKLMAADKKKNKLSPEDLADELVDLMQKDKEKRSFTAGDLRELARVKLGRKDGDDAYAYLVKNTAKLGVTMVKGENNNVRHYSVGTLPL